MAIAIQALFIALESLLAEPFGATIVSGFGAVLTILIRSSLAPLTMIFALTYGLLIDAFVFILRVKSPEYDVRNNRLILAIAISTVITGLVSYYTTVPILALVPSNPVLEITILVTDVIGGLLGGYLVALIWKRARWYIIDINP